MNRLYTKDNNPLFDKREFIKSKPQTFRNKVDAKDIVSTLEEKKVMLTNTGDPLMDLPDKDAALFCDLVYNPRLWGALYGRLSKGNLSINLKQAIAQLEIDLAKPPYSTTLESYFDKSNDYKVFKELQDTLYDPILEKYKLVVTSDAISSDDFIKADSGINFKKKYNDINFKSINYFGIAIAHAGDKKTRGIYIVNRGTAGTQDILVTDLGMAATRIIPYHTVVDHMRAGGYFAEFLLDKAVQKEFLSSDIQHIGFSGHSLGGSITQIQAVYFASLKTQGINLSRDVTFQAYGVKNVVDGVTFEFDGSWYHFAGNVLTSVVKISNNIIKSPMKLLPKKVVGVDFTGLGVTGEVIKTSRATIKMDHTKFSTNGCEEALKDLQAFVSTNYQANGAEAVVYQDGDVKGVIKVLETQTGAGSSLRTVRYISYGEPVVISEIAMPPASSDPSESLTREKVFLEKMINDINRFIDKDFDNLITENYDVFYNRLKNNYAKYKDNLNIVNYARQRDFIANSAKTICDQTIIEVNASVANYTLKALTIHSMTNYRYQGYNADNSLIVDMVDKDISDKYYEVYEGDPNLSSVATDYTAVFSKMKNYGSTKFASYNS